MENCKVCCRDEEKMVKCTLIALEKMKEMFGVVMGSHTATASKNQKNICYCDKNCQKLACPYQNKAPYFMQLLRRMSNEDDDDDEKERWQRKVTRLRQGELAIRGDRAYINLGQNADKPVPLTKDGRPTGPVFFNMRPEVTPWPPRTGQCGGGPAKLNQTTFQVLPPMPPTTELAVGPVTGMPIDKNEDLFVFRMGKQYEEFNDVSRFQMEVRLPKRLSPERTDVNTQFLVSDILPDVSKVKKTGAKNNKGGKNKKGAKKGKK